MEPARVKEAPFLVIERRCPAAPEKVWRAWTDPRALKRWFGPGAGERLKLTEQGAFLDGYDDAGSRERGTGALIDNLEKALRGLSG